MLNKVIIMGRIVRDPELKKMESGNAVCNFSVAVDRDYTSKQSSERETDFLDVTAWRSTAEFISKYFAKGRMIVVVGRLQKRNYTDKDNNRRSSVDIIAENVYFGDSKKSGENTETDDPANNHQSVPQQSSEFAETAEEDDLPF